MSGDRINSLAAGLRGSIALLLCALLLDGCASDPGPASLGAVRCESFFIYRLCVGDLDRSGDVDFMYFDDTKEIFMYALAMRRRSTG